MTERALPVRPNLDQLKNQAKDLLHAIHRAESSALEDLHTFHPKQIDPPTAKLADAQLILARSYGANSWTRLVQSCKLIDALWKDDLEGVRQLVLKHPNLLHEHAIVRKNNDSNWGPPLTYAANLGRDRIIEMLYQLGARDLRTALNRAALQSRVETARKIYRLMETPQLPEEPLRDPAYTLSTAGTALMLELGAKVYDSTGKPIAPVAVVLETDSRSPEAKHKILELYVQHGLKLPDTPTMALHRGRIDMLAEHLRRDPHLLERTFSFEEIYPPEWGCHDETLATHGTPLAGTTLLHMCVDYDEYDIAKWLIEQDMDVNTKAAVDKDGFGGHTALFATVVSQPASWMNHRGKKADGRFAELLLNAGADPNLRASLRKQMHPGYGPDTMHEYRDVTPLGWGENFHRQAFVNRTVMQLIAEHGGHL